MAKNQAVKKTLDLTFLRSFILIDFLDTSVTKLFKTVVHCHHELPETPVKVTKQGAKVHQGSKVCNPRVVKDGATGVFQGRDGRVIAVLVGLDGIVDGFGPELQTSGVRVFRTHCRLRQGNDEVSVNSYILFSIDFCTGVSKLFKAFYVLSCLVYCLGSDV